MAALNFPDSPAIGDIYTAPTGVQYQWDGSAWLVVSAAVGLPGPQGEDGQSVRYLGRIPTQASLDPEATNNELGDFYIDDQWGEGWMCVPIAQTSTGRGFNSMGRLVGEDGAPGPQGPAGIGITLKGTVATVADLPTGAIQGDTYVVEENGNAYSWSEADSQYIDIGKIVGPQGPQGEPGPAGADGKTGLEGPVGKQGEQGEPGPAGPAGADGADGAQGPKGDQGEQGIAGADGAQGPKGDTGAEGPQGIQGDVGPKGDIGNTGPQGEVGPVGPKGDQGDIGPAGPQGEVGPKGDQGDQGVPGLGITFQGRVATVGDLPATAAQGDMYIVSETGDAWVWANDVGAFENAGPIVGPTGPQGEAGAAGPTGPEGPQGLPGPTAVSADADNTAVLGTDGLLYVSKPTGFLPLAGGTMTGQIVADPATGVKLSTSTEIRKGATLTDIALMSGGSTKLNIGSTFSESFTPLKLPLAAPSDNQHAANKKYVDDKVAAGGASGAYVPLAGGDMTGSLGIYTASGFAIKAGKSSTDFYGQYQASNGQYRFEKGGASLMEWGPTTNQSFKPLLLPADPTNDLEAATKKYVDTKVGAGGGGDYLPLAGGTMTGAIRRTGIDVEALRFDTGFNIHAVGAVMQMRYNTTPLVAYGTAKILAKVPLELAAAPTADLEAATKKYVDDKVAAGGGSGSYTLPPATNVTLGGVKAGTGLVVAADGTLSTATGAFLPLAGGTMTGAITTPANATAMNFTNTYSMYSANGGVSFRFGATDLIAFSSSAVTAYKGIVTPASGIGVQFGTGGGYLAKGGTNGVGVYIGGALKWTFDGSTHTSVNPIALPGVPTAANHAATKQYVDDAVAAVPAGSTIVPMVAGSAAPDAALYPNGTLLVEY
jgi:hypothetical protein